MQKALLIINDDAEIVNAYNLDPDFVYEIVCKDGKWKIAKGKGVE